MQKESIDTGFQTEKPSAAEALNQAEALIESSHYKEAREKLQEISRNFQFPILSEPSYRFHYLRGLLFFRLGEQPAAWEEIEEALRIFKATNGSISLPERENLPDFVKDNLRKLRDIEIALLTVLQEPDGKENIGKKEALMERVSEISNLLENLSPLAKMHYYAGCIKMHLAKLEEAAEHLERAATGSLLSKDWAVLARALNGISNIYYFKGDLGLAIQIVEQARVFSLKAGDRHFETILQNNLAQYQLNLGLWRPAISTLFEVLVKIKKTKVTPYYCSVLLHWGYANLLGGRLKESKKAFGEALRLATEQNLMGFLEMSHGYFSMFCLEIEQFKEAENHLKKALEIARRVTRDGSTETFAWQFLGDVYVAQKKLDKAQKAYTACQSCLTQFPEKLDTGAMHRGMGVLNARQDQPQAARRNFKKALDLFETCNNHWEKAKTFVVAAESGVFSQAEMEPEIVWARDVFKKLEHPNWLKRARALLKKAKNPGRVVPLPLARELTEREQIAKALVNCNGNISQASKKLGLLRQTLQYKIRHYGIEV